MSQFEACILCGSPSIYALRGYEKHDLVKCDSWNFVFSKPIPTIQELQVRYAQYLRDNAISDITIKRYNALLDIFEKFRKTNNIVDVGN